jgi:hypothetical protein
VNHGIRLPARRCEEQGPDLGQPSGDIGAVRFVEPWPPVVKSLVKPRSEERFRADNVDGFNTRQASQQIEIGSEQPVGVGDPVLNGDNDVPGRRVGGLSDQMIAERVLVARVCLEDPPLVRAKGRGEKPCLLQNPFGAEVGW